MKTLPIFTYGFDVLRKKTKRITKVDDKLIELITNMYYTMRKAHGIGLAAPQIGKDLALTVIDISQTEEHEKEKPLTLINPVVVDSHGSVIMEEGCLSIPLLRSEIERPETVYIKYQDTDLNEHHIELKELFARVVQHEIDHLNGKLFIDYLSKEEKSRIKSDLDKIKKGDIEAGYLLAEINLPPAKKRKG